MPPKLSEGAALPLRPAREPAAPLRKAVPARDRLQGLVALARPRQQVKNLVVWAALVFAGRLGEARAVGDVFQAFLAFCFASAAIYAFNDVADRAADATHPVKRFRPVASGTVSPVLGLAAGLLWGVAAAALGWRVGASFAGVLAAYVALQVAYSLWLKRVPLIDLFGVAVGYVQRAVGGAVAVEASISPWLVLCTLLLALFLVVGKRLGELAQLGGEAGAHRVTLRVYSRELLQQLLSVVAGSLVVIYSLYAITSNTAQAHPGLAWTIPLVLYGLFRYFLLVTRPEQGAQPEEILLKDTQVRAVVLLWGAVVVWALYAG